MIPTPDRRANVVVPAGDATRNMVVHDWGDERNPRVVVCVTWPVAQRSRVSMWSPRHWPTAIACSAPTFPVVARRLVRQRGGLRIPNYIAAISAMFTQLGVSRYDWIGTSMGRLIGMVMAATPPRRCAASSSTTSAR